MAVTDFSAGETATELQKQLVLISAKSWKFKIFADKLIDLIKNIQPTIKEIQYYSGVELPPHHQAQIDKLSITLENGKKLTEKVLSFRRWNMYRQFTLARKMEKLEKAVSDFIKNEILAHILEDILLLIFHRFLPFLPRSFSWNGRAEEGEQVLVSNFFEVEPSAVKHFNGYAPMEIEKSIEMKKMEALKSISELVDITVRKKRTSTNFPMDGKVQPPQIQVFINFRGAQLCSNFIGYLVDALQKSGVNVFTDNYLNIGDDLDNLLKKIEDSGIAIVVFSSRYTQSKWCLNELVKIDERVNQGLLKVIPIFYKVTPTNVKRLKGEFGDNFRDQEYEFRFDEPKIKRWKEALESVSHKLGLTFDEKSSAPETDFVGNIVKEVLKMLQDISTMESSQSSCCAEKSKLMLSFDGEESHMKKYHQKNVNEITRLLSDLSI